MTSAPFATADGRQRWGWIAATALFARWITFGNPLVHIDEGFYLTVAEAMTRGQLPFVDIWDRKPLGLFLIYVPAALAPFDVAVYLYQALAFLSAVATAAMVARIADRLGWRRGALPAAIGYLLWLDLASGEGGQAAVFFNLPMAAAAWLILTNPARRSGRDAMAMLLVGLALQVKYSVVFEGLFFGLAALGRPRAEPAWLGRAMVLAGIALLPSLGVAIAYVVSGQFPAFFFANVQSVLLRPADPAPERYARLAAGALILLPHMAAAVAAARWHPITTERRFALAWFVVSIAGILIFGGWLDHYLLPAMLPGAVLSAGFFDAAATRRYLAPAVLGVAAVAAQVALLRHHAARGNAHQFAAVRAAVDAAPTGCLFVYSGPTVLYPASHRCALSRFVFPNHLYKVAEAPAIGTDQRAEVARILDRQPAVIVMRPWKPGERRDIRAQVVAAVRHDYALAARLPVGHDQVAVLYRRGQP